MSTTTCYACGKPAMLKCLNPNCWHYFCSDHGDFTCADCHRQKQYQQSTVARQQQMQQKVTRGIVGILIAVFIGFLVFCWEIIKAVLRGI